MPESKSNNGYLQNEVRLAILETHQEDLTLDIKEVKSKIEEIGDNLYSIKESVTESKQVHTIMLSKLENQDLLIKKYTEKLDDFHQKFIEHHMEEKVSREKYETEQENQKAKQKMIWGILAGIFVSIIGLVVKAFLGS